MESAEGWERWAEYLERLRRAADRWPDGQLPRADLTYLLVDGFHSASHTHWLYHEHDEVQLLFRQAELPGTCCGFSYAGLGLPYEAEHTRLALHVSSQRLSSYLSGLTARRRLVAIGFSLGAVVTLLGVRAWLRTNPPNAATALSAVILVAPAHSASALLRRSYNLWVGEGRKLYEEWVERGRRGRPPDARRVPAAVVELTARHGHIAAGVSDTVPLLARHRIPLHVLYWPNDALTPYEALSAVPYAQETPVRENEALSSLQRAVPMHMATRDHAETRAKLVDTLKALVPL